MPLCIFVRIILRSANLSLGGCVKLTPASRSRLEAAFTQHLRENFALLSTHEMISWEENDKTDVEWLTPKERFMHRGKKQPTTTLFGEKVRDTGCPICFCTWVGLTRILRDSVCPNLSRIRQKGLHDLSRWRNAQIKINPTQISWADGTPCRGMRYFVSSVFKTSRDTAVNDQKYFRQIRDCARKDFPPR